MRSISSCVSGARLGSSPRSACNTGRTGRRQWVQAQLRVVRLAAPAMRILGAIVDEEQKVSRRQPLDQTVQQGLCF